MLAKYKCTLNTDHSQSYVSVHIWKGHPSFFFFNSNDSYVLMWEKLFFISYHRNTTYFIISCLTLELNLLVQNTCKVYVPVFLDTGLKQSVK